MCNVGFTKAPVPRCGLGEVVNVDLLNWQSGTQVPGGPGAPGVHKFYKENPISLTKNECEGPLWRKTSLQSVVSVFLVTEGTLTHKQIWAVSTDHRVNVWLFICADGPTSETVTYWQSEKVCLFGCHFSGKSSANVLKRTNVFVFWVYIMI